MAARPRAVVLPAPLRAVPSSVIHEKNIAAASAGRIHAWASAHGAGITQPAAISTAIPRGNQTRRFCNHPVASEPNPRETNPTTTSIKAARGR